MDKQQNIEARPGDAERPQEAGAASPGRAGRMSRQRKTAAVLRLLRGEDLETVSRGLGVTAATLSGWHDAFLAAGEAALVTKSDKLRGHRNARHLASGETQFRTRGIQAAGDAGQAG